jgi:GDPmannose 4,6-dehydratase
LTARFCLVKPETEAQVATVKRALVTGITGQDASYLAELLLAKGYEVHGLVRRVAGEKESNRFSRITHLFDQLTLHSGSLDNYASIFKVFCKERFDECYHLAAQSFVAESFTDGFSTMQTNINGTHYLLESIREMQPNCRFYFAASSEMFGKVEEIPQREVTRFHPRSPYGISKVAGFDLTRHYREAYDLFTCNGILFNHESPRRGESFVTRKIAKAVARISAGMRETLSLGNLTAARDWGYAPEYVEAMYLMLQQETPHDFVIATGETHTVQEFCEQAFQHVGLNYRDHVVMDEALLRPAEVDLLIGDASRAKSVLGWEPKVRFKELVQLMVDAEVNRLASCPELAVT